MDNAIHVTPMHTISQIKSIRTRYGMTRDGMTWTEKRETENLVSKQWGKSKALRSWTKIRSLALVHSWQPWLEWSLDICEKKFRSSNSRTVARTMPITRHKVQWNSRVRGFAAGHVSKYWNFDGFRFILSNGGLAEAFSKCRNISSFWRKIL